MSENTTGGEVEQSTGSTPDADRGREREREREGDRDGERGDDGEDGFPDADQLIGAFLREASLWPVLAVILGSCGAFTAALIVLAAIDRNPFAAAALILLLGMTVDVVFRARSRPSYRNGALLLVLVWSVGIVFAGLAIWSGIAFSS
jgi:hypothetical protein